MHKDGHIRDKITSVTPADRASVLPRLLDTLSIIETLLASPKVRLPRESSDEEIVVLFRNLWFISTVLGLTMHKTSDAEEHKVILRSIAFKTPCLLQYTQGNYVETELEYNPFIRKEHGQVSIHDTWLVLPADIRLSRQKRLEMSLTALSGSINPSTRGAFRIPKSCFSLQW